MKVTTINITAVKLSNKKPQYTTKKSELIQEANLIVHTLCDKTTS